MAQETRPDADVFVDGWLPLPLWQQLDEPAPPDDTTYITSPTLPPDNTFHSTFVVALTPLGAPIAGTPELMLYLLLIRLDGSDCVAALVTLIDTIDGTDRWIKSRVFNVTPGFHYYPLELTYLEAAQIEDYTTLKVMVMVGGYPCPSGDTNYSSSSSSSSGPDVSVSSSIVTPSSSNRSSGNLNNDSSSSSSSASSGSGSKGTTGCCASSGTTAAMILSGCPTCAGTYTLIGQNFPGAKEWSTSIHCSDDQPGVTNLIKVNCTGNGNWLWSVVGATVIGTGSTVLTDNGDCTLSGSYPTTCGILTIVVVNPCC